VRNLTAATAGSAERATASARRDDAAIHRQFGDNTGT